MLQYNKLKKEKNMNKKPFIALVVCAIAIPATMFFTGCGEHEHHISQLWTYNETEHWHACDAGENCEEKEDVGRHVFDDDNDSFCDVCSYIRVAVENPIEFLTNNRETTFNGKAQGIKKGVDFNVASDVVVEYKVKGADDNTYTKYAPSGAGEYTARVSFDGNAVYKSTVGTMDFKINKKKITSLNEAPIERLYQGTSDIKVLPGSVPEMFECGFSGSNSGLIFKVDSKDVGERNILSVEFFGGLDEDFEFENTQTKLTIEPYPIVVQNQIPTLYKSNGEWMTTFEQETYVNKEKITIKINKTKDWKDGDVYNIVGSADEVDDNSEYATVVVDDGIGGNYEVEFFQMQFRCFAPVTKVTGVGYDENVTEFEVADVEYKSKTITLKYKQGDFRDFIFDSAHEIGTVNISVYCRSIYPTAIAGFSVRGFKGNYYIYDFNNKKLDWDMSKTSDIVLPLSKYAGNGKITDSEGCWIFTDSNIELSCRAEYTALPKQEYETITLGNATEKNFEFSGAYTIYKLTTTTAGKYHFDFAYDNALEINTIVYAYNSETQTYTGYVLDTNGNVDIGANENIFVYIISKNGTGTVATTVSLV